ncbi:MAG TPA: hypothetical protein VGF67_15630 [Ktedonobacteraceae bacterium]
MQEQGRYADESLLLRGGIATDGVARQHPGSPQCASQTPASYLRRSLGMPESVTQM